MQKIKCRKIAKRAAAAFIAAGVLVAGCRKMPVVQKKKENGGVMERVPKKTYVYNYEFDGYKFSLDSNTKIMIVDINGEKKKFDDVAGGLHPKVYRLRKGIYAVHSIKSMGISVIKIDGANIRVRKYVSPELFSAPDKFIYYKDNAIALSPAKDRVSVVFIPINGLSKGEIMPESRVIAKFKKPFDEMPYICDFSIENGVLKVDVGDLLNVEHFETKL